jgi:hypothetical protein
MAKRRVSLFAFLFLPASTLLAQSAIPTSNVLTRMTVLESQYGTGSTFSIDVENREYWITAKHMLTGANHSPYGSIAIKSVSLRLLNPAGEGERWITVKFSVIDTEKDVDIVVLAPPTPLLTNPLPSVSLDSAGIPFGGDCEFLGFPYGGGWQTKFNNGQPYWLPFMKHCIISGANNLAGMKGGAGKFGFSTGLTTSVSLAVQ